MPIERWILITGGTDGIGLQTAVDLLRDPSNFVIIHARSSRRSDEATEIIKEKLGHSRIENLGFVFADFSSMTEVQSLIPVVKEKYPHLNVLLLNAGVLQKSRTLTSDHVESTFQINHLSHYVIARQLTPLLAQNAPSRIVFVSSMCYSWYPLDFDDLQCSKNYEKYLQYSRSKLMNHLTCFKMARELPTGVSSVVLEPGVIDTKLCRNGDYTGSPVEGGSRATIFCCTDKQIDIESGSYYDSKGRKIKNLMKDALNRDIQERLWKVTEDTCHELGIVFD